MTVKPPPNNGSDRSDDLQQDPSVKRGNPALSGFALLKSTSVVGLMTLLSRVLGLVRDIVFARVFGAGLVMDAFIVANRIPNMLRRFFAEGAFSQGFVPVLARYREGDDHAEARKLLDAVAGTMGLALFVITAIGVIAAPLLVFAVAPGFIDGDGRFDLAAAMLRFTFPYLLFVALTAFAGGILNTYGKFGAPAFTPVILNVVLISAALWVAPNLAVPGMALAYGVFFAGVVQLIFQIPFLAKIDAMPRPRWQPTHAGVKRIGRLMLPAIFGSSVAQINVLIGGILASLLGVGKISYLYYSDRLMEFPLGVFGIALATVMLPTLSRQAANGESKNFSDTLDWSMRLVLVISVPAAVGLAVLAVPLMATLFYGGTFTLQDVSMAAVSLQAFALGLIGFSFVKILAPAFFAREDTRTPVRFAVIALIVNVVLSIGFAGAMTAMQFAANHAGLALATSAAALVNAWLLYRDLRRSGTLNLSAGWSRLIAKMFVASILMTAVLLVLHRPLDWWVSSELSARSMYLLFSVVTGAGVYAVALMMSGLRPSHFYLSRHE